MKMTHDHANSIRLIANEIIRQLYEAGKLSQIKILHIATTRSLEELSAKSVDEDEK